MGSGAAGDGELSVEMLDDGATPVLRISGELDLSTVEHAWAQIEPHLGGPLVLEMAAVDFIDSSGVSVLLRAARGASLQLRRPSAAVRRVLEASGLDDTFPVA